MTQDPYHPEPPFEYECVDCSQRFGPDDLDHLAADDELIACPECGGDIWNLTTPSRE